MQIFPLSNSKELTLKMCNILDIPMGELQVDKFSDGEILPYFKDSIREKNIYIVGSLDSSDSIVEMQLVLDAAKRSGAKKITPVITYMGYARQDRKESSDDRHRSPIGASAMARMLEYMGADQFMIVDLHAGQIEGFFSKPVTHVMGKTIFIPFLKKEFNDNASDWVICSPDQGGATRAAKIAERLEIELVIIHKQRNKPNEVSSMQILGKDIIKGKKVLIVDDMADTAGSLVKASNLLLENGAEEVSALITHGVLSGPAYERLANSNIKKVYVSDTVPIPSEKGGHKRPEQLEIVSCADTLARILKAIDSKSSTRQIQYDIETR